MSEEIRQRFEEWRNKCGFGSLPYIPLFEAYDAVHKFRDEWFQRLEEENKLQIGANVYLRKLFDDLEAKNKKLKEALEHIREYWNGGNESAVNAIEEAEETAREALESEDSETTKEDSRDYDKDGFFDVEKHREKYHSD